MDLDSAPIKQFSKATALAIICSALPQLHILQEKVEKGCWKGQ